MGICGNKGRLSIATDSSAPSLYSPNRPRCHTSVRVFYDESSNHVRLDSLSEIKDLLMRIEGILERDGVLSGNLLQPVAVEARITFLETFTASVNVAQQPSTPTQCVGDYRDEFVDPRRFGAL